MLRVNTLEGLVLAGWEIDEIFSEDGKLIKQVVWERDEVNYKHLFTITRKEYFIPESIMGRKKKEQVSEIEIKENYDYKNGVVYGRMNRLYTFERTTKKVLTDIEIFEKKLLSEKHNLYHNYDKKGFTSSTDTELLSIGLIIIESLLYNLNDMKSKNNENYYGKFTEEQWKKLLSRKNITEYVYYELIDEDDELNNCNILNRDEFNKLISKII